MIEAIGMYIFSISLLYSYNYNAFLKYIDKDNRLLTIMTK